MLFTDEPTTVIVRIPPEDLVDPNYLEELQHVYLRASSQSAVLSFDESTQVLLSYKAGFTFLQTDKPIYTPNQKGKF